MEICKYFGTYGIDVFANKRLKLSFLDELNDPFESLIGIKHNEPSLEEFKNRVRSEEFKRNCWILRGVSVEDVGLAVSDENIEKQYEKYIQYVRNDLTDKQLDDGRSAARKATAGNFGILCFSQVTEKGAKEDILMWAHYADSYKGIKIVFDTDLMGVISKSIEIVEYVEELLLLDFAPYYSDDKETQKSFFSKVWKTKSKIWEYEKEVRWLFDKREAKACKKGDEFFWFVDIDLKGVKEVYLGLNMDKEEKRNYTNVIKERFPHIKLFESKLHLHKYEIVYKEI